MKNDGIVLIDKNEGETSFDVVRKIKRLFKDIKIGHAGTLDPFATGLLIILLGQGVKLSQYLMSGAKRYLGTMTLGVETDTLDKTGRVVRMINVPELDEERIKKIAEGFVGDIEQIPPAYSAINCGGQRAYKLARQGIAVDLKKRTVTIDSIDIRSIELPDIEFEVACSSGTYIRSLAVDIGERLGSAAHLKALRRLTSGCFKVRDAMDSNLLTCSESFDAVKTRIIPLGEALPDMKECRIDKETAQGIRNGRRPSWREITNLAPSLEGYRGSVKVMDDLSLAAVMEVDLKPNNEEWLLNMRVFN